jgi:hypothetical protein
MEKMTYQRIEEIFNEYVSGNWEGDHAFEGLKILSKYTSNLIQGADHDIIYSESVQHLINYGITEEDCKKLRSFNWMIHSEYCLACFV